MTLTSCFFLPITFIRILNLLFIFAVFPLEPASSDKDFISLTEYLLPKINHEDNNAVLLGYGLYKDSLESPLCPALLKTALAKLKSKEPDAQNLYHSNVFQKQNLHPYDEDFPFTRRHDVLF